VDAFGNVLFALNTACLDRQTFTRWGGGGGGGGGEEQRELAERARNWTRRPSSSLNNRKSLLLSTDLRSSLLPWVGRIQVFAIQAGWVSDKKSRI